MTYVFFAYECYPYPIIRHLLDEGQEVIVAVIESASQLMIPDREPEKISEKRQRLSIYDKMVKKQPLAAVMKMLSEVPRKERDQYFIFFDFNDMYAISEKVMAMGFKNGLFPTKFYYEMERNRLKAKTFVKANYDEIRVAEAKSFSSVEDGIAFLESKEDVYVLKSNGNHADTVVPKSDDPEEAREKIIEALRAHKNDYENGGFLLEKKLPDCIEVTPVLVFYNGEPIYSVVEIESKQFGAGNIGVQKGGNLCLSVHTDIGCALNEMSFPKAVYELAAKHPGLAIFDIGLMYDGEEFYFTEFCAMRYGWDGIFSEMVMADDGRPFVSRYFQSIASGKNPIVNEYGASVRLFNLNGQLEETGVSEDDASVEWPEDVGNNLFMYRIREKNKGRYVSVGGLDLLGVATGASNVMETAVGKAYEIAEKVSFDHLYYRPKFDFLSMDYKSSITNRLFAIRPFLEVLQ